MKVLMSGNEAIARGAYEAGVSVAVGYPGTPSTEILENIVKYPTIKAQWSPNEKVAMEVGIGAAFAGARSLVTMKHVGVNVAADPLFTVAYTGVRGGLVLISADDPGMHSSQNEQDNRYYGKFAKIPVLEPSDSQEAKDFIHLAYEISEQFDTPVILRITTRIAHSQTLVESKEPVAPVKYPYQKDEKKYVMVPAFARERHVAVEKRRVELVKYAETSPLNQVHYGNLRVGVITSGIAYQYVKEAAPDASVLKLGLTNPLSPNLIRQFAAQVEKLYVVEELEPFIEEQVKALGLDCIGKEVLPRMGELSVFAVAELLAEKPVDEIAASSEARLKPFAAPPRPPVLCPGCPHRGVFYTLKQLKLTVSGDIGCYTLGALAPLSTIDTCVCMGYSIGGALGMEKAEPEMARRMVAVIGDSTFLHSGITGLLDVVYNKGTTTTLILDNRITAMTGQQPNPASGQDLMGNSVSQVDLETLVRALGVKRVRVVDPFDLPALKSAIKEELAAEEPSVIIARRPCIFVDPNVSGLSVAITDACTRCKACMQLGCPALKFAGSKVQVDSTLCNGCNLCVSVCRFGSILPADRKQVNSNG
ncbi:MAG TPA: indolepyruvate ferredoxin oxidoreductase subunit alpha [Verrucomicrobiae bacterium]|nr:indolepyruvate ferredoxin oxidoreductase subunit alpha [Verrucomicrobiae bacterium]